MKPAEKIIVVGGGLSGLTLSYLLSKENVTTTIVEASSRLGGRIETIKGNNGTPLELGATWFSDLHMNLLGLIEELGLTKYAQYSGGISLFQTKSFEPAQEFFVPPAEQPSYRLAGGTEMLIDKLSQHLPKENIHLNKRVTAVKETSNGLVVETIDGATFEADRVVVCIPPQLAAARIQFSPALPEPVMQMLPTVQTWMAGAIKFVLEYSEPFWRNKGYSGMLYSNAGIVTEMYDHTNFDENKYGFTGFLNGGAAAYDQEVRKEFVLRQLTELLGGDIMGFTTYADKVWNNEFVVAGNPVILRPHQNNGHPVLRASYMNERLHFCGTETADVCPGYMEGAIVSASSIAERL